MTVRDKWTPSADCQPMTFMKHVDNYCCRFRDCLSQQRDLFCKLLRMVLATSQFSITMVRVSLPNMSLPSEKLGEGLSILTLISFSLTFLQHTLSFPFSVDALAVLSLLPVLRLSEYKLYDNSTRFRCSFISYFSYTLAPCLARSQLCCFVWLRQSFISLKTVVTVRFCTAHLPRLNFS